MISHAATENSKAAESGSLAWTNLVAPIGLVPAAETFKVQGLGFRVLSASGSAD